MKLSIDGETKSLFAEGNLAKNIYRQYMKNELDWQIYDEVKYFESTEEADDQKSLEYHYDLRETIKTFNDYLCIVFLNLANILIYPNETFYMKYLENNFRIEANQALQMANKICKRMQDEFKDIIYENFPIRETAARISRVEKESEDVFDTKEITIKKNQRPNLRSKRRNNSLFPLSLHCSSCLLNVKYFLFNLKSSNVFDKMSWKCLIHFSLNCKH